MSIANLENRAKNTRKMLGHFGIEKSNLEKQKYVVHRFFKSLKPKKQLDLDDWMDKNFYLTSETSSEPGRWRTDRFPFLRSIAKRLSPSSPCQEIGVKKGAQLGFTTLATGYLIYIADMCPGPTLYVMPTKETVEDFEEQKLKSVIDSCPKAYNTLGAGRAKKFKSKKLKKYFPGGYIALVSSHAAASLRSKSIKHAIVDEEDGCSQDVQHEGSSIYLALRRTSNFPDRKIFRISTPLHKDTSSIEPYVNSGTAERYMLPCPKCNTTADRYGTCFDLRWAFIKYENNNASSAALCCPSCGSLIDEVNKTWMLDNGFWFRFSPTPKPGFGNDERRAELLLALEKDGYWSLTKESIRYIEDTSIDYDDEIKATYNCISSLYSPLGFYSWSQAVKEWLEANDKKDKNMLKTFVNTVLGETYSETALSIDFKNLKSRREFYCIDGSFQIPNEVLFVTAGVDVQKDRVEVHTIGTGIDREEWVIDYKVFYGETNILGDKNLMYMGVKTCWGQLHEYLEHAKYVHESGQILPIECTLIDCRYRSNIVFTFCRAMLNRKVFPARGVDGWGKGLINIPTKSNAHGVYVFELYTDELKDQLYTQLGNHKPGINYVHFSSSVNYPSNYFKGLVVEELKTKQVGFKLVKYWYTPNGARNEPLDTYILAKGAVLAMRPSFQARRDILDGKYNELQKAKGRVLSKGVIGDV